MVDVRFIVLREVVLYIWREIEGGSWAGGRGRSGGGDLRLLAPFQAKRLPQELLSKPGASLQCSRAFVA